MGAAPIRAAACQTTPIRPCHAVCTAARTGRGEYRVLPPPPCTWNDSGTLCLAARGGAIRSWWRGLRQPPGSFRGPCLDLPWTVRDHLGRPRFQDHAGLRPERGWKPGRNGSRLPSGKSGVGPRSARRWHGRNHRATDPGFGSSPTSTPARKQSRCWSGRPSGTGPRGHDAERRRPVLAARRNRWDEAPFRHWHRRKQWQGGTSRATRRIVLESGACTVREWHGRTWIYRQGMERDPRTAMRLRGKPRPTGTLRILPQDSGQVAIHYALDEDTARGTKPCGTKPSAWDKGCTAACGLRRGTPRRGVWATDRPQGQRRPQAQGGAPQPAPGGRDETSRGRERAAGGQHPPSQPLGIPKWNRRPRQRHAQVWEHQCRSTTAPVQSAKVRHRNTRRRLGGGTRDLRADTPTAISRRRGSASVWVNPACTSHIDSRTGLWQGTRCGGPVLRPGRSRAGGGRQRHPQQPGAQVRQGDCVVHVLQGR